MGHANIKPIISEVKKFHFSFSLILKSVSLLSTHKPHSSARMEVADRIHLLLVLSCQKMIMLKGMRKISEKEEEGYSLTQEDCR